MTALAWRSVCGLCLLAVLEGSAATAEPEAHLRAEAERALRKGADFFRTRVAVEGSHVWIVSEDLQRREGEGVVGATRGWIQPPGTPAVGLAMLRAFEVTQDAFYLDAARESAGALLRGQLKSGGWSYYVEFDPKQRDTLDYRFDGGGRKARRVTTFDDNVTQSAIRFLMRLDRALRFSDARIHEAVGYALDAVVRAQYPNGAWPQGYEEFPDAARFPVLPAGYPDSWPREWPGSQSYWLRYTLNDQSHRDLVGMLFEATQIYGPDEPGPRCRAAAIRGGEFLLAAQLPEPQPGWAQQYDFAMHPAWARKFEPPAVTGGESQGALRTLMQVYRETGDARFLEPIPRALAWMRRSRLADGRLARFYELKTNEPLYFTRDYRLTKSDADVPTHYSFKVADESEAIAAEFERLRRLDAAGLKKSLDREPRRFSAELADAARAAVAAQDAQGRWVETGGLAYHKPEDPSERVIRSDTFNRNMETLCRLIEATHRDSGPRRSGNGAAR